MLQILATGFMIFSLQELMEAYSDHPGILSLSIEKAQGNFGRGLTSMKMNLEYYVERLMLNNIFIYT